MTQTTKRSSHGLSLSGHSPSSVSLIGSYEQSLLSGRIWSSRKANLPFQATLSVTPASAHKLPAPHLPLAFDAYYSADDIGNSPYVGHIDLDAHYLQHMPSFPGYRIPEQGTVQLIVKNNNRTALKVFLVPYDLSDMPHATKTFLQQKSYVTPTSAPSTSKGNLKYAIHLQFCCPPARNPNSPRRFYLYRLIKVVFAFRSPDATEQLYSICDTPQGYASSEVHKKYSPYDGPSQEWLAARRAKREGEQLKQALHGLHLEGTASLERNGPTRLDEPDPASLLATPASFDRDACAFGTSAAPAPPPPATLMFQRLPSRPISPVESGLSISRPGSRIQDRDRSSQSATPGLAIR